jgi:hypothetical protein
MIVLSVEPAESWSCYGCQKTHENSFWLDFKRFCSYKCAWNFLWKICFGWFEWQPKTKAWLNNQYQEVGGFKVCVKEGWDDETLTFYCKEGYPSIFNKLDYERQKWAFQFTKIKMQELQNA